MTLEEIREAKDRVIRARISGEKGPWDLMEWDLMRQEDAITGRDRNAEFAKRLKEALNK